MSSIGPVVSEENMFENVDGCRTTDDTRTTDAGVTGIANNDQYALQTLPVLHFMISFKFLN